MTGTDRPSPILFYGMSLIPAARPGIFPPAGRSVRISWSLLRCTGTSTGQFPERTTA